MFANFRRAIAHLTPEKTSQWTLAFYPMATLLGVGYILITKTEITAEMVALFVGLVTAGSLKAAIKSDSSRHEDEDEKSGDSPVSFGHIRYSGGEELEKKNRRRPNNSGGGRNFLDWLFRDSVYYISG